MKPNLQTLHKQQGMTLLVAMITLVVLMLLGLGAMEASKTMFKLAGNLQFENEAKNRAENTLIIAESWLMSGGGAANAGFTTPGGVAPYYDTTATAPLSPLTNWPSAASQPAGISGGQFIVQQLTPVNGKVSPPNQSTCMGCQQSAASPTYNLFRVTARGTTYRGAARYIESIVQVP